MFRLIKLAAYLLLGYALYEFIRGFTAELPPLERGDSAPAAPRRDTPSAPVGALTGGGPGMTVQTQAGDGSAARHVVGRGIVSR